MSCLQVSNNSCSTPVANPAIVPQLYFLTVLLYMNMTVVGKCQPVL